MSVAEAPLRQGLADWDLDADELYEVIDGLRVEVLPLSAYNTLVAHRLLFRIQEHIAPNGAGQVVIESLFRLPLPTERNRRPDVAFVSASRWPLDRPVPLAGNDWEVVPDLAVEIISPNDVVDELTDKLNDYFESGVRRVWVVHPHRRFVLIHDSLSAVRGLAESDDLDGENILQGLHIPIKSLFPPRI